MKFAHLADCHIGGWSEKELEKLSIQAFEQAIDTCIQTHVAFVIIAGDLFNTSLPPIDLIKETTRILNKLKAQEISCYIIPGSHDYSPSGKTMIDVLENADLVTNVCKFTENDKIKLKFSIDKTGTKLTGLFGKKQGLETTYYEKLDRSIEQEPGFKIFLFHTLLSELKTKELEMIETESLAILPKNFNYYAGGHPHIVKDIQKENYGVIAYPGPTFPNNFSELEKLKQGGFYIIEDTTPLTLNFIPLKLKEVLSLNIDVDNLSPLEAFDKIVSSVESNDIKDKIVTLRVFGSLNSGKISDIDFRKILDSMDCYIVLRNTNKLSTKEFEKLEINSGETLDVEDKLIDDNLNSSLFDKAKIKELMDVLSEEKVEGESVSGFEERLLREVEKVLE